MKEKILKLDLTYKLALSGAALGLCFWILDSVLDSVFFSGRPFADELLRPENMCVWMRIFVWVSFIAFGIITGTVVSRTRRSDKERRSAANFAATVFNSMHDAISLINAADHRIVDVNEAFLKELGVKREDVLGKTCYEVTQEKGTPCMPPDKPCPLHDAVSCGKYTVYEHVHYKADGEKAFFDVSVQPVKNGNGSINQVIHISRNVTERKITEARMQKLSTAVESAADPIIITDREGVIEYVNASFEKLTGYSKEEAVGNNPKMLKSGSHDRQFYKELWETILSGRVYRNMFINKKKNGELYYDECTIAPLFDANGTLTHFVATAKDLTLQKQLEEKLRKSAEHDFLTNIYNRRKFYEILENEVERANRHSRQLSITMFDIDHFKAVNDTFGHDKGDYVLKTVAGIVEESIRKTDIFARYGGEEFVILAPETDLEGAAGIAEKSRNSIESFDFDYAGKLTASFGVASFEKGMTADKLVQEADRLLYLAKNNGRNRVERLKTGQKA
ncbi:MAG: diguanylate cyclase [Nitrospirae bacterium]|nr:MAG: diguanylate cyclase [Nitrospirota bacterium]